MMWGSLRFVWKGWIEKLYLEPQFFFKFYGFEWVKPLGETGMYLLFGVAIVSALFIALGLFYRLAAIAFFLSFTYIELIDATNYLNHYYLVCLFAFLLIFLPANRAFSLDVWRKPQLKLNTVPAWCINILILQLTIVYTCAGIAKLNSDWLFRAMPLAVWLPEHTDLPILGYFFQFKETAYLFSWVGAFYDLTIAYFLMFSVTRPLAYIAVVVFHGLTYVLFNIGLFPLIMVLSTLAFFPANFHDKLLGWIGFERRDEEMESFLEHGDTEAQRRGSENLDNSWKLCQRLEPAEHRDTKAQKRGSENLDNSCKLCQRLEPAEHRDTKAQKRGSENLDNSCKLCQRLEPAEHKGTEAQRRGSENLDNTFTVWQRLKRWVVNDKRQANLNTITNSSTYRRFSKTSLQIFLATYILLQLLLPFRHHLYNGNVMWTEEGYRFAWRVMLVEKVGQVRFFVADEETQRKTEIINGRHLTLYQEKQMSIQPDFILQFAHFLADEYKTHHGMKNPVVTVDAHVALNGRTSQQFIDPNVNLASIEDGFGKKNWILRFER